jgi:hypothetical protein
MPASSLDGGCEKISRVIGRVDGYLFATFDEEESEPDNKRSNNQRMGPLAVGTADLVVQRVNARLTNGRLEFEYEVCNQGVDPVGKTSVGFYRSPDPDIDIFDVAVAGAQLQPFVGFGCQTGVARASRVPADGRYFLGAIVDPEGGIKEAIESNNLASAGTIYLGSVLDAAVTKVWASSVMAGNIVLQAEVCNLGNDPLPSTRVDFYLTDVIGRLPGGPANLPVDYFVETVLTGGLSPGKCTVLTTHPYSGTVGSPTFPAANIFTPDGVQENNWTAGREFIPVQHGDLEVTDARYANGIFEATICNRSVGAIWWGAYLFESGDDRFNPLDGRDYQVATLAAAQSAIAAGSCLTVTYAYVVPHPWTRLGINVDGDQDNLRNNYLLAPP